MTPSSSQLEVWDHGTNTISTCQDGAARPGRPTPPQQLKAGWPGG